MRHTTPRPHAFHLLWPALLLGTLAGCSTGPAQTTQEQSAELQAQNAVTPTQTGFTIKRGVNLTGWFQYGDYNPARLGDLAVLKTMGADFVRLPIEPSRFYDAKSPDWKNLETTLNEARRVGIRVIVDLHPAYNTQRLALTGDARYPALLTALARKLPQWGLDKVALELMNEPIAPEGDSCNPAFDWNPWQARFHAAARAGSKDLTLILTGACWGGIDGLLRVKPINDPRLIYSLHNYDEMPFTHQGASWSGWTLAYARGVPYPPTPAKLAAALPEILYRVPTARMREQIQGELEVYGKSGFGQATMQTRLQKAADWAKTNNTRLLLGEYGVLKTVAPPQDRLSWINDMRNVAEKLGIAYAMWDYNPDGSFGPFRNGKLEAGAVKAQGFTPPPGAVPTPPNPVITRSPMPNPVEAARLDFADFSLGSQSNFGAPTSYYGYGKPDMPRYTPSPDNRAPIQSGHLQFDYNLPLNNDFAGVAAIIPYKAGAVLDTTPYTHLRISLKVTGGSKVRVELASSKLDNGGDHPNVELPTQDDWGWETYTIALENFAQSGWGKKIDVAAALKLVENVAITPIETGAAGTISIDNIAFVKLADAANPPPLSAAQARPIQNFEGETGALGGVTDVYGYEQNAAKKTVVGSGRVGGALKVDFQLMGGQDWAGAVAVTQFQKNDVPINVQELGAVRLDLAAVGTDNLRVEFGADGFETANDNPQMRLKVTPTLTTYRLPISAFGQAGWGTTVSVAEFLKKAKTLSVFADTVGSQGKFTVDNIVLERK
jgi:endoglucanase